MGSMILNIDQSIIEQFAMHKTKAREKRKALKARAQKLARDARAATKATGILPEARPMS